MLFLTDVDHVSFEKANETRQNNLQSATVSLQVVIGLCKRKETAALKIKAAVSNGRVKLSALRRLFFFCRRPADNILGDNQLFVLFIAVLYILFVRLWEARHTELQPIPALHEWALPSDE